MRCALATDSLHTLWQDVAGVACLRNLVLYQRVAWVRRFKVQQSTRIKADSLQDALFRKSGSKVLQAWARTGAVLRWVLVLCCC